MFVDWKNQCSENQYTTQSNLQIQCKPYQATSGVFHRARRNKTPLFAGDLILYIENPKDTTRKLLELINEYSKVAGYKINSQKSLAFLYTNEKTEREIKETIPFTIATKRKKIILVQFSRLVMSDSL